EQVFDWAEGDCELKIEEQAAAEPVAAAASPVAEPVKAVESKPQQSEPARPHLAAVPAHEPPHDTPAKQGLGDGSSIRVSTEKIDELMNTVGELVITRSMLTQLGAKLEGTLVE